MPPSHVVKNKQVILERSSDTLSQHLPVQSRRVHIERQIVDIGGAILPDLLEKLIALRMCIQIGICLVSPAQNIIVIVRWSSVAKNFELAENCIDR